LAESVLHHQVNMTMLSFRDRSYIIIFYRTNHRRGPVRPQTHDHGLISMSIDKSLRRKNQLARARSVLTRGERIKVLKEQEKWVDGRSPFGLPKVRVVKHVVKKAKKEKAAEAVPGAEGAAPGAAPGAAAATPAGGKPAAGGKK
jgi:small basic protein (TIGR04137 family)